MTGHTAPLSERLKASTAALHVRAEEALAPLVSGDDLASYTTLLLFWLGFYRPWEREMVAAAAAPRAGSAGDALVRERSWKSGAIRRDLEAIGMPAADVDGAPECPDVPTPRCDGTLLGGLYVTEGSSLGNRILARSYRERLGPAAPLSFLEGEGRNTGQEWKSFTTILDSVADSDTGERAEAAAAEMFLVIIGWAGHARSVGSAA